MDKLKENAEKGRLLYNSGKITRDEAKKLIMPFINEYNKKAKEIAKKYNIKPKTITFIQYVR